MVMAALSPGSVLASPIQVNPQVRTDLQGSVPQVAEDAQQTAKAIQTDTITISAEALKMADDRHVVSKEASDRADKQQEERQAQEKERAAAMKSEAQRNAEKAYAAASAA